MRLALVAESSGQSLTRASAADRLDLSVRNERRSDALVIDFLQETWLRAFNISCCVCRRTCKCGGYSCLICGSNFHATGSFLVCLARRLANCGLRVYCDPLIFHRVKAQ